MVNHLIFLFFLLPLFLFSGEFTASVSHNQIYVGESLTLNLTLKHASAKGTPSVDALKTLFSIHSQQQVFNTIINNGQVSSSTTWKLTLIPQKEGEVVIPSLSIQTSEGLLSSEPIKIQVVKGTVNAHSDSSDTHDIILTANVNNAKPYKNEPVIYTVKIVSKKDLANIQMQKLNIDDAIVETNGEPKIYQKVVDGINVGVVEFNYLITPLKAGPLKIPSMTIGGMMPIKRNTHHGSFFDDDLDLFSMISGFDRLKPFTLATEESIVDVQPAVAGMTPWLPAQSLKIEEIWDESQSLQVGEPFTRGFKIIAEGIQSHQLPSLNDLQMSDPFFKIYADKPELGDERKDDNIESYRKEHYTLIPQRSGSLILPELSIAWWDVTKKEKVLTHIPSRTLQVLPPPENRQKSKMIPPVEEGLTAPVSQSVVIQRAPILYALIAGLAILLLMAIVWGLILQKKMRRLTKALADLKNTNHREKYSQRSPISDKREKLPDLNPT